MEMAPKRIYTAPVISRVCARKSTKVLCALDSGSVTVKVSDLLTHAQAGTQCPGSTWKKYHPHRHNVVYYHGFIAQYLTAE